MSPQVVLTWSDDVYARARQWAALTRRDLPATLTDALAIVRTPLFESPEGEPPVTSMSDAEVTALSLEPGWCVYHWAYSDRTRDGRRAALEQYGCCDCEAELGSSEMASTHGAVNSCRAFNPYRRICELYRSAAPGYTGVGLSGKIERIPWRPWRRADVLVGWQTKHHQTR